VVLLDRDGVINETAPRGREMHGEAPLDPDEVRLVPGAVQELRRLMDSGFDLACITNQPAPAKGEASVEEVNAIHRRVIGLLADEGVNLAAERICMHHPEGTSGCELSVPCDCRKPAPGMLTSVMTELGSDPTRSWMVGDTDSDIFAGEAAGVRTVLIDYPATTHKRLGTARPTVKSPTLHEAVDAILRSGTGIDQGLKWAR
jgi:D-glycero-D-manno-heptose 1,7-bisphosphate phosphatase